MSVLRLLQCHTAFWYQVMLSADLHGRVLYLHLHSLGTGSHKLLVEGRAFVDCLTVRLNGVVLVRETSTDIHVLAQPTKGSQDLYKEVGIKAQLSPLKIVEIKNAYLVKWI